MSIFKAALVWIRLLLPLLVVAVVNAISRFLVLLPFRFPLLVCSAPRTLSFCFFVVRNKRFPRFDCRSFSAPALVSLSPVIYIPSPIYNTETRRIPLPLLVPADLLCSVLLLYVAWSASFFFLGLSLSLSSLWCFRILIACC